MRSTGSESFYLSFLQYWSNFPQFMRRSLVRFARLYILFFRCTGSFTWSNSALWMCSTSSIDGSLTWRSLRKGHFHVLPDLTIQVRVGARMRWTVLALGIFLVMEQTPIFGLRVAEPDYLAWLRPLIASSKGSVALFNITRLTHQLMELGMFPIGVISVVSFFVEMFSWWEPVPIRKGDSDVRQTAKAGTVSQGQN